MEASRLSPVSRGRVTVNGQQILYRAYTVTKNAIHVGTYYPW